MDGGASHIQPGQPAVSKGRHGIAEEGDGEEDEVDLVGFTGEDTDARLRFEDVDACHDEESGSELDRESNGNVANYEAPATDPRSDFAIRRWRDHEGLVVDASTCGVDAGDLAQRGSDTHDDQGDGEPAPDDVGGPSADDGVVEGRGQTVGDGGEDKGHEGDLQGGPRAHQLGLVAHGGEQLVGIVAAAIVARVLVVEAQLGVLLSGGAGDHVVLSGIRIGLRAVAVVGHEGRVAVVLSRGGGAGAGGGWSRSRALCHGPTRISAGFEGLQRDVSRRKVQAR